MAAPRIPPRLRPASPGSLPSLHLDACLSLLVARAAPFPSKPRASAVFPFSFSRCPSFDRSCVFLSAALLLRFRRARGRYARAEPTTHGAGLGCLAVAAAS
ncbi:unnamed protein product [Urochloa humidicola]